MREEVSGWRFLAYYGVIYLVFVGVILVGYPLAQRYATPLASLIFPIAGGNSLLKNLIVDTLMYWGMVLFYTLAIRKIRLRF
jgi:hypothetical protein